VRTIFKAPNRILQHDSICENKKHRLPLEYYWWNLLQSLKNPEKFSVETSITELIKSTDVITLLENEITE
jgi:hypothetical protein